jgi:outer membrane lipoprotein carrier protein
MKRIALVLIAVSSMAAWAGGLESLETFIRTVKTGRAEFSQVVTSPPKDGQTARSRTSSGSFEFSRPNRFRFVYRKPFEQTLVADGQTLWLHDVDLNQVTARKQAQALGSTPAALIASAADLRALQADFSLSELADKDGLQWVQAIPRNRDAQLQSIRIGFRGPDLTALDISDSFGQRSVLNFTGFVANAALDSASFQFRPPPGADLIRQ